MKRMKKIVKSTHKKQKVRGNKKSNFWPWVSHNPTVNPFT